MGKNQVEKKASLLVRMLIFMIALAVVAVVPAKEVDAKKKSPKKKITLASGKTAPKEVYVGKTYKLKVSGVKVKFYSSNKKKATINAKNGKMKVVAPGSVKITAKNKKTGKVVATKKFTILQRANTITTNVKTICLENVGETATITVKKTPVKSTDVIAFVSANKNVAKVDAKTGKVTAVAPGKTTVTVYSKATSKKSNSDKENKKTTVSITVLKRAKTITVAEKELCIEKIGDQANLTVKKDPATTTDVIEFVSANKNIAKVDAKTGKVTAVAPGKTTITVYSKATAAKSNTDAGTKKASVDVYVGVYMEAAVQTKVNEITLTYKTDVSDNKIVPKDFVVKNSETNKPQAIKYATAKGNTVTLEMYNEIKDGKTYTVKYDAFTANFTATDGKVSALAVNPKAIVVKATTTITIEEYDAKGVWLNEYAADDKPENVKCTIEVTDGKVEGDAVYFNSIDSKATVRAEYLEKESVVATTETVIRAVAKPTIAEDGFGYTLSKSEVDFDSDNYKQRICIPLNDSEYQVYFKFVDANKKEISQAEYSGLSLSSSNNTVFMISENMDEQKKVEIVPVGKGEANIIVKDVTGAELATLPVTIGDAPIPTTMWFEKPTITLSNSDWLNDTATIGVVAKDQYGDAMTGGALEINKITETAEDVVAMDDRVTFSGAGRQGGTYEYEVYYRFDGKRYLNTTYTITILDADQSKEKTYKAIMVPNTIDLNKKFSYWDAEARIGLGIYYNNALYEKIAVDDYMLKINSIVDADGNPLSPTYYDKYTGVIYIKIKDDDIIYNIPTGVYTITLTYANETEPMSFTTTLTVVDSQPEIEAIQTKFETDKSSVDEIVKDVIDVKYGGKAGADWEFDTANSETVLSPNGKTLVVKKLAIILNTKNGKISKIFDVNYEVEVK